jgi:pyridoxamine 5'-phosphate oxidase
MEPTNIADLRLDYKLASLDESDVDPSPFLQFEKWFQQALETQLKEPNAMTLATVDPECRPSARIVLLKGFDERGFVFFTNYESKKGQELAGNPNVALVFYWVELERQVRITGTVTKVTREESAAYFRTRPVSSRLGACISRQSAVIPGRDFLESEMARLAAEYSDDEVPLPDFWGGYRVKPDSFEFWQGRRSRLHDRIRYRPEGDSWTIERLSP